MEEGEGAGEDSFESELARLLKYLDLYLQQKTDLFVQRYLVEPFGFFAKQAMILALVVTLLVSGTVIVLAGAIMLLSEFVPFWAALLLAGGTILAGAAIFAHRLLSNELILDTPTVEAIEHEDA